MEKTGSSDVVISAGFQVPEHQSSLNAGLHFLSQVFNIGLWEEMKQKRVRNVEQERQDAF